MGDGRGSPKSAISLDDTVVVLSDAPTRLLEAIGINTTAARAFIQFFDVNKASDVVLGTTAPISVLPMLANAHEITRSHLVFRKGMAVASTTDVNNGVAAITHLFVSLG